MIIRINQLFHRVNSIKDLTLKHLMDDQNEEILNLIKERMDLGLQRYGHGVQVGDDTRQWGTKKDNWSEMALEEVLDGMIYMAAQIIRILKNKTS